MKHLIRFATGACALAFTGFSAPAAFAEYSLTILHVNDFHSRFLPINKYDSTCSEKDAAKNECFGGIARIKTKIDQRSKAITKSGGNVLTLSAGDMFQGSMFYTTYKGSATVEFMNGMSFDAMVVGNHEFDDGPEGLSEFAKKASFPVIAGNMDISGEPLLKGEIKPYSIIEKGGQKIAVVGIITTETPEISSPGNNISFQDSVEYLQKIVPEIEGQGVNKIVVLSHIGFNEDKKIAETVKGVDVVVGGHSNTLLSNFAKRAKGPYPAIAKGVDGNDVPIVSAYAYGKYLGELKITFDDNGVVTASAGKAHVLDSFVTEDKGFKERVASLNAPIEEIKAKVIGSAADAIDGDRNNCRAVECSMGNLVADAMLDRVKGQGVTIAVQNGGGLRASIDAGDITMGEVLTVLPFQNTLATFQLKGADLLAAMENGVSQVEDGKGKFPQVAGMRFSWDKSGEAGKNRVKQVQVMEGGAWTDVDPAKTYGVVTNNFVRGGGDGYKMFATNGMNAYDYGPGLENVLADYLAANPNYKPYTDGRILEGAMFEGESMKMDKDAKAGAEEKVEMKASIGKPTAKPSEVMMTDYVVKTGDNLWTIAKQAYGDANMWKKIEKANGVDNVRNLKVGQTLKLPK